MENKNERVRYEYLLRHLILYSVREEMRQFHPRSLMQRSTSAETTLTPITGILIEMVKAFPWFAGHEETLFPQVEKLFVKMGTLDVSDVTFWGSLTQMDKLEFMLVHWISDYFTEVLLARSRLPPPPLPMISTHNKTSPESTYSHSSSFPKSPRKSTGSTSQSDLDEEQVRLVLDLYQQWLDIKTRYNFFLHLYNALHQFPSIWEIPLHSLSSPSLVSSDSATSEQQSAFLAIRNLTDSVAVVLGTAFYYFLHSGPSAESNLHRAKLLFALMPFKSVLFMLRHTIGGSGGDPNKSNHHPSSSSNPEDQLHLHVQSPSEKKAQPSTSPTSSFFHFDWKFLYGGQSQQPSETPNSPPSASSPSPSAAANTEGSLRMKILEYISSLLCWKPFGFESLFQKMMRVVLAKSSSASANRARKELQKEIGHSHLSLYEEKLHQLVYGQSPSSASPSASHSTTPSSSSATSKRASTASVRPLPTATMTDEQAVLYILNNDQALLQSFYLYNFHSGKDLRKKSPRSPRPLPVEEGPLDKTEETRRAELCGNLCRLLEHEVQKRDEAQIIEALGGSEVADLFMAVASLFLSVCPSLTSSTTIPVRCGGSDSSSTSSSCGHKCQKKSPRSKSNGDCSAMDQQTVSNVDISIALIEKMASLTQQILDVSSEHAKKSSDANEEDEAHDEEEEEPSGSSSDGETQFVVEEDEEDEVESQSLDARESKHESQESTEQNTSINIKLKLNLKSMKKKMKQQKQQHQERKSARKSKKMAKMQQKEQLLKNEYTRLARELLGEVWHFAHLQTYLFDPSTSSTAAGPTSPRGTSSSSSSSSSSSGSSPSSSSNKLLDLFMWLNSLFNMTLSPSTSPTPSSSSSPMSSSGGCYSEQSDIVLQIQKQMETTPERSVQWQKELDVLESYYGNRRGRHQKRLQTLTEQDADAYGEERKWQQMQHSKEAMHFLLDKPLDPAFANLSMVNKELLHGTFLPMYVNIVGEAAMQQFNL